MSPDPVIDDEGEAVEAPVELAESLETEDIETVARLKPRTPDADEPPSYLRSSEYPLFGGQTVADDLARRGAGLSEDVDLDDLEDDVETARAPQSAMSTFLRGAWIVGQCIAAVAFGAGLFVAFDQLWKWNNIVALGAVRPGHPRPGGRRAGGTQDRRHRQHADRGRGRCAGHAGAAGAAAIGLGRAKHVRPAIKVGLSTASVYPLRTEAAFEYAARLGYDGVELMVWAESVSQDIDDVEQLSERYGGPGVVGACPVPADLAAGVGRQSRSRSSIAACAPPSSSVRRPSSCIRRFGGSAATRRLRRAGRRAGGVQRRDGGRGEHVPVPGRPVLRRRADVDRADA